MHVNYGGFQVKVMADEKEIEGPNEFALSDRFGELDEQLWEYIQSILAQDFPEFRFDMIGG